MKKIILVLFILLIVGCGKKNYITCNVEVNNNIQNYTMNGSYKIYYNNNYVTRIEKQERYISPDKTMLDYFNEYKNLEYSNLNYLYNGYSFKIDSDEKSVDIDADIDMSLVNIKKMIKDDYLDKNYVINNKLTTSGIVKIYESKGAVCNI